MAGDLGMTRWARSALLVSLALAASFAAPSVACALETTPSVSTTAPYELDFTLPTDAKSGCLVCHGDPALVRIRDGVVRSYFIDPETISSSAHADQQCVGCHVDFTYKAPHGKEDWKVVAKSACRNCHDEQSLAVGRGVHRASTTTATAGAASAASRETTPAPPLCGDCHGSHDITLLTTDTPEARAGKRALHANGWQICGRCHEEYWDNYADYYHGAAYKRGAPDAPACWDCHGWHDILPSSERGSRVNERHLVETCGQSGCHVGVDEHYVEYAVFIHGREAIASKNPIQVWLRRIADLLGGIFGGKGE